MWREIEMPLVFSQKTKARIKFTKKVLLSKVDCDMYAEKFAKSREPCKDET
jgi:hypothetical protein